MSYSYYYSSPGPHRGGTCGGPAQPMHGVRGIGSGSGANIGLKCIVYIYMTLVMMGKVGQGRLYVI